MTRRKPININENWISPLLWLDLNYGAFSGSDPMSLLARHRYYSMNTGTDFSIFELHASVRYLLDGVVLQKLLNPIYHAIVSRGDEIGY